MADQSLVGSNDTSDRSPEVRRRARSRDEIEADIDAQRDKIRQDLKALKAEFKFFPAQRYIREYPVAAAVGAGILGFAVSRILFGKKRSGTGWTEATREEILDGVLDRLVEDAAQKVARGRDREEAIRETLREHGPFIFEVEGDSGGGRMHMAATLLHILFNLSESHLKEHFGGWSGTGGSAPPGDSPS